MRLSSTVKDKMGTAQAVLILLISISLVKGFLVGHRHQLRVPTSSQRTQGAKTTTYMSSTDIDESSLGLTPRLLEVSRAFQLMDERTRVQNLLALASSMKPMKDFRKLSENKVPGCLSTVYVHAFMQDGKVYFEGDSDAQLTKGLVALLIEGMSGCSAEEIQAVKPEFIKYAGIAASLTPG